MITSRQKNSFAIYYDGCLVNFVTMGVLLIQLQQVREKKRVTFRIDPHYRTSLDTDMLPDF
jgi:hypothetical protein